MFNQPNRWKNSAMWISLVSLVFLVLTKLGIDVPLITQKAVEDVVVAIVGILVVLGILNNPTTENQGFFDDKQQGE